MRESLIKISLSRLKMNNILMGGNGVIMEGQLWYG